MSSPEAWIEDAACQDEDTELFFPGKHEQRKLKAAQAICAECVVREDCLEYALAERIQHGVFGGTSERQRRRIRRERRLGVTA